MKNIRFYNAEKYETSEYEKVEEYIYKTIEEVSDNEDSLWLRQFNDEELSKKLLELDGWKQGEGELDDSYLLMEYEGKRFYRDIDSVGTDEDFVFVNENDDKEPGEIYVTSIMFEPEPELGENESTDAFVSQYPLEDILDEYFVYCYDDYKNENEADKVNSYVEFASEDIDDIRKVLTILGKHVYNQEDGDYVKLIVEQIIIYNANYYKQNCT